MAQLKDLIVNGPSRFLGPAIASADPTQDMELATKQYVDNNGSLYTFASGTTGNFTVTPDGGSAQTVSIGKPSTAGTADKATAANTTTTTNAIAKYSNTTGSFANSGVTIDSSNNISTSGNLTATELKGYVTIGQKTGTTKGTSATAEGVNNISTGNQSHTEGKSTIALGESAHAEGGVCSYSPGFSPSPNIYSNVTIYVDSTDKTKITKINFNNTEYVAGTTSPKLSDILSIYQVIKQNNSLRFINRVENNYFYLNGSLSGTETTFSDCIIYKDYVFAGERSSHAEGFLTSALGIISHAENFQTIAYGLYSHAEGCQTKATGQISHAEGNNTTASGLSSHTEGYRTIASGDCSHAEGDTTTASGNYSHAENAQTMASGLKSHSEGEYTIAEGEGAHAEGSGGFQSSRFINITGDANSLIYTITSEIPSNLYVGTVICQNSNGGGTIAIITNKSDNIITLSNTLSSSAISDGKYYYSISNYAKGMGSHAEGSYTTATGNYSHAEGCGTTASGNSSHAEGTFTTASGNYSHTEGSQTTASGNYSHTEGSQTIAYGNYSHTEGQGTTANKRSQHVFGEFNKVETRSNSGDRGTYIEIVGNGDGSSARSNARTLDWSGNQKLAGTNTTSATWNDYAEGRKVLGDFKPGQVVKENGDGTLSLSSSRLARGCEIISDTYGMLISDNEDYPVPIAVAGRVLAYPDKDISTFEIGAPVCAGENGTVSQMTEEEERLYPSRILGTVSEIPSYKEWGPKDKKVQVDGRIWIRIR